MAAIRCIGAGVAVSLSVAVASALAADVAPNPSSAAASVESSDSSAAPKKKVRVIDMSAEKAADSDQTRWYNRASKPPVQKNVAKAETAHPHPEARPEKPKKKQTVRRAAPRQEAYSAYASEPTRERRGFGLFDW